MVTDALPGLSFGRAAEIYWVRCHMNVKVIEEAIDKYVDERMKEGKKRASEHFLAYAYLKIGRDEVMEFMRKVGGLSRYYINFLKVMENPFRGPEMAWFLSMVTVAIYSCYLVAQEDMRLLGLLVLSGTIFHAWILIKLVAKKWSEVGVMIAIYREIVEMVEQEAATAA
jgi:hypothetical protein